jgi:hypothetical protein
MGRPLILHRLCSYEKGMYPLIQAGAAECYSFYIDMRLIICFYTEKHGWEYSLLKGEVAYLFIHRYSTIRA